MEQKVGKFVIDAVKVAVLFIVSMVFVFFVLIMIGKMLDVTGMSDRIVKEADGNSSTIVGLRVFFIFSSTAGLLITILLIYIYKTNNKLALLTQQIRELKEEKNLVNELQSTHSSHI
jgi:Na+/melibiose symporter-like transporter